MSKLKLLSVIALSLALSGAVYAAGRRRRRWTWRRRPLRWRRPFRRWRSFRWWAFRGGHLAVADISAAHAWAASGAVARISAASAAAGRVSPAADGTSAAGPRSSRSAGRSSFSANRSSLAAIPPAMRWPAGTQASGRGPFTTRSSSRAVAGALHNRSALHNPGTRAQIAATAATSRLA